MICDECQKYVTIKWSTLNNNNNNYCHDCIKKYMLIKCPGNLCDNIVSLNGYDGITNIELETCSVCDAIFCNNCLIRGKNFIICRECFNS